MKTYPNMSLDYILHKMSYANLLMYSRVIPSYGKEEKSNESTTFTGKRKGLTGEQFMNAMKELKNG